MWEGKHGRKRADMFWWQSGGRWWMAEGSERESTSVHVSDWAGFDFGGGHCGRQQPAGVSSDGKKKPQGVFLRCGIPPDVKKNNKKTKSSRCNSMRRRSSKAIRWLVLRIFHRSGRDVHDISRTFSRLLHSAVITYYKKHTSHTKLVFFTAINMK